MYLELPTIDEVIKQPETTKIPTEVNVMYALVCALADAIKGDNKLRIADQLCKYAIRLPDEITGTLFRKMAVKCSEIVTNIEYDNWVNRHHFILGL